MIAWRVCKAAHDPFDATGALITGGRWNSPGRAVLYAADSFAGSLLEILAHSLRPRTLPGRHHAVRLEIPDDAIEVLDEAALSGWHLRESPAARDFGDQWLEEKRSLALSVPALTARPVGRVIVINPAHENAPRLDRGAPFNVPWDERLF